MSVRNDPVRLAQADEDMPFPPSEQDRLALGDGMRLVMGLDHHVMRLAEGVAHPRLGRGAAPGGADGDRAALADQAVERDGGGLILRHDPCQAARADAGQRKRGGQRDRRGQPGRHRAEELLHREADEAEKGEEDDEQDEQRNPADAEPGEQIAAVDVGIQVEMGGAQPKAQRLDGADHQHDRQRYRERQVLRCENEFQHDPQPSIRA